MARRFHERQLQDAPERIAALIHPEAEMTLVVNDFGSVQGRDEIIAMPGEARQRMIYSAWVERCEKIDETTLLLRGQARYPLERGLAHSTVDWQPLIVTPEVAIITGTAIYEEPPSVYSNLWVLRLDADGRCREFTEWWMLHPAEPKQPA